MKTLSKIRLIPELNSEELIVIKGGGGAGFPNDQEESDGDSGSSCKCPSTCDRCDAINMRGQGQQNSASIMSAPPIKYP